MTRRALADAVSLVLGATAIAWVGFVLYVLWWWGR